MNAIDIFAGLGGFSEGAEQAGCTVVWAANHWRAAVDTHAANHPETAHACQDLHQADWRDDPELEYHNQVETCHHGVWPRHDCQWCKDEFEE